MGSLRVSSVRIAVCVLGMVCLFSSLHDTSANPGPVKRERELAQNVFHHMTPKRNNGNRNGGNYRNVPIPARPLGPEKVRAMRRHFKFPLLKRASNDAARVKGVGQKWQDVVKSDTSDAGINTGTQEQQQQKSPTSQGNNQRKKKQEQKKNQQNQQKKKQEEQKNQQQQQQQQKQGGKPIRPQRAPQIQTSVKNPDTDNIMSVKNAETTSVEAATGIEEQLRQQAQHAPENTSIMDVVSSFVPSTSNIEAEPSPSNDSNKKRHGKAAGISIALLGIIGVAFVVVRRRRSGKEEVQLASSNTPIRVIDENGNAVDLETQYGFGGSISLGSRSSVSRGYMGYHL